MNFVDTFEKTLTDAITVDGLRPDGSPTGTMMLVDGDYIPTSSPRAAQESQALPSGIGAAGLGWSSLMRRDSGSGSSTGGKRPPSARTNKNHLDDWSGGDLGEVGMSPPLVPSSTFANTSAEQNGILSPTSPAKQAHTSLPNSQSSTQARLQASRAKHSKRMSLPGNFAAGPPALPPRQASSPNKSFGLDNVSETEEKETDDAWGW